MYPRMLSDIANNFSSLLKFRVDHNKTSGQKRLLYQVRQYSLP